MLETLKKKSGKSRMTRAIVSIVIVIGLLALTKFAIFDVITGPTKLDLTSSPDAYEGKYVTIDVENYLTDYVEHSTTTTNTTSGHKSTRVDGNSYIVFNAFDDYEQNASVWYYYSVYMNKNMQTDFYDKIDETWDYWFDETGTVAPPAPTTVTGTWTKLSSQLERYYRETLTEMGVEENEFDVIYLYTVDTAKIGGQSAGFFWVCMAAALLLLIYFIYNIINYFNSTYISSVNAYLRNNTTVSMAAIEADFSQAHPIGKNVWVGRKWTIYMDGPKAKILSNGDLLWGYYYRRTGKNSASQMRLFTTAKKMFSINLSEAETQEALKFYGEEQPHMVIGYSKELETCYQKNYEQFLNLKYNPAKNMEQTDAYFRDGGESNY